MCCFVDPLSIQCKHVTVAQILRRGRGPVGNRALRAERAQGLWGACWEPLLPWHLGLLLAEHSAPSPSLPGAGSVSQSLLGQAARGLSSAGALRAHRAAS